MTKYLIVLPVVVFCSWLFVFWKYEPRYKDHLQISKDMIVWTDLTNTVSITNLTSITNIEWVVVVTNQGLAYFRVRREIL